MPDELRFSKGTWMDLGNLIKEGFDRGIIPVKIAFEDVNLPVIIESNQPITIKNTQVGLRDLVLSIIKTTYKLPNGTLTSESDLKSNAKEPYSRYLVYTPLHEQ